MKLGDRDEELVKIRLDGQQLHDYLDRVEIPPLLATWLQTGEISILVPFTKCLPAHRGSANDPVADVRIAEIGSGLNMENR